ncbi:MAG: cytochrome c biogenesis protein CcdA [Chloroflexota bacterium]
MITGITDWLAALGPFGLGLLNMTNPCVLPMYPGFLAFIAGNQQIMENRRTARWLGAVTLAGVLISMLVIGLLLAILQVAVGQALSLLLPLVYAIVIVMGILLLLNVNPFARLPAIRSPRLKNPILSSFLYGMLYGPMALPCSGALVVGAFANAVSVQSALDGIGYFVLFGLGFGFPLLVLPFLADPVRKWLIKWMLDHHILLAKIAGAILIVIGVAGLINEWPLISYFILGTR